METNYTVSIHRRCFTKVPHFIPTRQQTYPPWAILVSDWLIFEKSYSEATWPNGTKLYRKHLCWCPLQRFPILSRLYCKYGCRLIGWYFKVFSFETAWQNGTKHLWEILYKVSSFNLYWTRNMAPMGKSCFWLAVISEIFSETTWPNGTRL